MYITHNACLSLAFHKYTFFSKRLYVAMALALLVFGCEFDSEKPGVIVSPPSGLVTSENGDSAQFTVALKSKPDAAVVVPIRSSNTNEAVVDTEQVRFSIDDWDTPKTVSVSGVDDSVLDGDTAYSIDFSPTQSNDKRYHNLSLSAISAVNQDNDSSPNPPKPSAGVTVTPNTPLTTSENQTSASFSLVLSSQPASDVTITATSSDSGEGVVSPLSTTFSPATWDSGVTFTITGVNDDSVDGTIAYVINLTAQSADPDYNGISIAPVQAQNLDNDTAVPPPQTPGVSITPDSGLVTSESQTSASFTVALTSAPSSNVTINMESSDITEGLVSPGSLSFTADNWDTVQAVTITGVDDTSVDGDINYSISFSVQSADNTYDGMALTSVSATNQDNDSAGITLTPDTGLVTSENLTSDSFTVVLDSQPANTVSVTITSSNTDEGSLSPATLTFTTGNWNTPQTVTVTGVDDTVVDGDVAYSIDFTVQSADSNYNAMALTSIAATNQDNDTPPPPGNYFLYIEPASIEIAASTISGNGAATLPAMGFSQNVGPPGQTPGPVIEAVVGQTITIEVVNDHLNTHRFEIEGLLTNTPDLLPGDTQQFQFIPTQAGVYRYGDPQLLSRAQGLHGAVVVRPAGNAKTAWTGGPAFAQERTWVISDFDETWLRNPSAVDTTIYNPNYFLMNGKSGFAAILDPASTIDGNVGETFLIRIVNAGQFDQSLHFHSNHFQIISEGGFKYTDLASAPVVSTINVKRGSTAMLLFTLTKAGTYPVHVHSAQMQTGNGVDMNGTATYIIGR